jgi:hypothetical protein
MGILRRILGLVAAVLVLGILAGAVPGLLSRYASRPDDFVQYWDSASVLLAARNPYLPSELANWPKPSGWPASSEFNTWVPPWTIPFLLPFGLVAYPVARLLWLALCFALVFGAGHFWLRVYIGPERIVRWYWLVPVVVLSCYPVVVVLSIGQIGPLVLAGLTGWFYFTERGRDFLAGSCLLLAAIKPHLLIVFWSALLLWVLRSRRWGQMWGGALALILAACVPLLWNPQVVGQYLAIVTGHPPVFWATSTVGALLMFGLGSARGWILFIPALVGIIWVSFHVTRHRDSWGWRDRLPLILLVSVLTTPFGWYWDLVILVPALMQVTAWLVARRSLVLTIFPIYLVINLGAYVMNLFAADALFYFWMAPALLVLFLVARTRYSRFVLPPTSSVTP